MHAALLIRFVGVEGGRGFECQEKNQGSLSRRLGRGHANRPDHALGRRQPPHLFLIVPRCSILPFYLFLSSPLSLLILLSSPRTLSVSLPPLSDPASIMSQVGGGGSFRGNHNSQRPGNQGRSGAPSNPSTIPAVPTSPAAAGPSHSEISSGVSDSRKRQSKRDEVCFLSFYSSQPCFLDPWSHKKINPLFFSLGLCETCVLNILFLRLTGNPSEDRK